MHSNFDRAVNPIRHWKTVRSVVEHREVGLLRAALRCPRSFLLVDGLEEGVYGDLGHKLRTEGQRCLIDVEMCIV